jgi:hypothetical protein
MRAPKIRQIIAHQHRQWLSNGKFALRMGIDNRQHGI